MQKLYTQAGKHLPEIPWNTYPRPQMRRERWLCLNGTWDFQCGEVKGSIVVPFCPESLLSGLDGFSDYGREMIYRRSFTIPADWKRDRILLHFGAVSRHAEVWVNKKKVCTHENGYLPFSADITDYIREAENELQVHAVNDISPKHPWGKQKIKRGGMWYTPVSGIWQTVWLEPVPEDHIQGLRIQTHGNNVTITADGSADGVVTLDGQEYRMEQGSAVFSIDDPVFWTPEQPYLYHFSVTCGEDHVDSYFALRDLSVGTVGGKKRLFLNGKPFFFHGLLDQGYWSDGLYTPAVPEAFEQDILAMKSLGFNTLRKHIKIEPQQFYYDCDRLGMIVFQDMVNCGIYRYIRDTVLPTIGLQKHPDRNLHRDPEMRRNFVQAMEETVKLLKNHPSICLWTIFNEGWGQFCADEMYDLLKGMDQTRWIDATSGWFHQKKSDVDSRHIYFSKLKLGDKPLPQLLSEFGGYSLKIQSHCANLDKNYGYRDFEDRASFVSALQELYLTHILPMLEEGLSGAIYTQVSDVEDETNGFLTYDRSVMKVTPDEMREITKKIHMITADLMRDSAAPVL